MSRQSSDRDRLRILVVTNMYPSASHRYRGIFVRDQVESLRRRGHEVALLNIDTRPGKAKYVTGRRDLARLLKREKFDLIHFHYGLTAVCGTGLGLPFSVLTLHGSDILKPSQRPFTLFNIVRRIDQVVAVSQRIVDRIPAWISRGRRVVVLPCGVDQERFRPGDRADARGKLGLGADETVLLFPADPARSVKNWPLFEEVCARLPFERVRTLTLVDIPNEEVPLYFHAADLTLMTSHSEGSPQAIKESLLCGTRAVSTDVGDVGEYLPQFEGCAVGRPDAGELAQAVEAALRSDAPIDVEKVRQRFGLGSIAERLEAVYFEGLGG